MNKRVVITGYGVVSPIGSGEKFKNNLLNGVSGIRRITRFDTCDFNTKVAGEVIDFEPEEYFSRMLVQNTPRFGQYALRAAQLAVENAGLQIDDSNRADIGVYAGSAMTAIDAMEEYSNYMNDENFRALKKGQARKGVNQAAAILIQKFFGTQGPCMTVTTACSSAMNALHNACKDIQLGNTEIGIVGGSDTFAKYSMYHLSRESGMSRWNGNPSEASKPFDRDSEGWVISEGGAYLVVESEECARKRGATMLGEIAGMGASTDMTMMLETDETGVTFSAAIRRALESSGTAPVEIDFINAHAPGIKAADRCEANALRLVFGDRYCKVPITSIKSILGNPSAGASMMQIISALITLEEGIITPTINFSFPVDGCEGLNIITKPENADINSILVNCHAADGTNASAILRRVN